MVSSPLLFSCPDPYFYSVDSRDVQSQPLLPLLTMYSKTDCPLCDEAKEKLRPLLGRVRFQEVDITSPQNKHLFGRFRYEIPVIHYNGEFLMKNKGISVKILEDRLESEATSDGS
jgi:glutaredoxin